MQEISPITNQQAPKEPAKTTPTQITDSFSELLDALLETGILNNTEAPVPDKPATPNASFQASPKDASASLDEALIRRILQLFQKAGSTPELPEGAIASPKKPVISTKSTVLQAPNENSSAPDNALDLARQILAAAGDAAKIKKTQPEPAVPALPELEIGTLSAIPSLERPVPEKLNLEEFDVTSFEYKIETDPSRTEMQFRQQPELQAELILRSSIPVRESKPAKLNSDYDALTQDSGTSPETLTPPATITRAEAVQHVHLLFEPPPAPPTVRSVSMDIGDAESQVRVVIREKNGNLNVQFGAANDRLRQDLQASGPLLMRELQRDNPLPVTLDFSNFGSATESDRRPRFQWQAKKSLKPGAEFADAAETAYLSPSSSTPKSIGLQ